MNGGDKIKASLAPGSGLEMIDRLKKETFNVETEKKLESHPYVLAAENGTLTMTQRQAFVCEQLAIQQSDAISFARLAGHNNFFPTSLAEAQVPEPIDDDTKGEQTDIFQFLLGGEVYAANLLLKHAKSVNLEDEQSIKSHQQLSALAQAYPSYWARLSLSNKRAAGAAACAVNFPAWGRMCKRLHVALASNEHKYGYSGGLKDDGLAFIEFFATPIDNLDEMAARAIEKEGAVYEDLVEHVRLLQEYEAYFWDAVFSVAQKLT